MKQGAKKYVRRRQKRSAVQRGAQNNMSLERTVDSQIPLVAEHLTNLQLIQNMRLNLQAKETRLDNIPEAERPSMRLQLEQEQKELALKELQLNQRSFELFSQYSVFECEKSNELQLLSQMRFGIRGDSSNTRRRCKVVKDFESLQAKVKDLFEVDQDEKIILYHGKNVVGSEEELIFAFDDRLNELKRKRGSIQMDEDNENFIEFEVAVAKYNACKRRRIANDPDDDLEKSDDQQSLINEGRWSREEIFLFSEGVKQCGWSRWSKISETIPGRTEDQVRAFSRTKAGLEFKPQPIQTQMLKDMLQGFRDTAAIARDVIKQETSLKFAPPAVDDSRSRSTSPAPLSGDTTSPNGGPRQRRSRSPNSV